MSHLYGDSPEEAERRREQEATAYVPTPLEVIRHLAGVHDGFNTDASRMMVKALNELAQQIDAEELPYPAVVGRLQVMAEHVKAAINDVRSNWNKERFPK